MLKCVVLTPNSLHLWLIKMGATIPDSDLVTLGVVQIEFINIYNYRRLQGWFAVNIGELPFGRTNRSNLAHDSTSGGTCGYFPHGSFRCRHSSHFELSGAAKTCHPQPPPSGLWKIKSGARTASGVSTIFQAFMLCANFVGFITLIVGGKYPTLCRIFIFWM